MSNLRIATDVPNQIHLTRVFAAPRHLVVKAMSTPALLTKWLGGKRARVTSAEIDFRVGGRYRYAFETRDGKTFAFTGVYQEILADRTVHTEAFEGMPGDSVVTTTWTEEKGQTTMDVVVTYPSREIRDYVLSTGMSDGAGESYDELEKLVTAAGAL